MNKVLMSMALVGISLGGAVILRNTSEALASPAMTVRAQEQVQEPQRSTRSPEAATEASQSSNAARSTSKEPELKRLPFCGRVKDVETPKAKNGYHVCRARNVLKPIPQTKEERKSLLPSSEGKKVIDTRAYGRWTSIHNPLLSPDGKWVIYSHSSVLGEGEMIVRATRGSKEFRVPRGRVFARNQRSRDESASDTAETAEITSDSQFVIFTIGSSAAEMPSDEYAALPKDRRKPLALGLLRLADGNLTRFLDVSKFALDRRNGRYIALMQDGVLVLAELATRIKVRIDNVTKFAFDPSGRYLAFIVQSEDENESGVFVRELETGRVVSHLTGPGEYRSLTFDASGRQFAFLSERGENSQRSGRYALYFTDSPLGIARATVEPEQLKNGSRISPTTPLKFVRSANALTFGIVARRADGTQQLGLGGAQFDLWHWNDPIIQSQRKKQADQEHSYLAVLHLPERHWVQLGSEAIPYTFLTADAAYAVGIDQRPYMVAETWGEFAADVYVIDAHSGAARLLRKEYRTGDWLPFRPFHLSPGGRYLLLFENRRWYSYDFKKKKLVDLTGALLPDVRFENDAAPRPARPVGLAGWTAEDRHVLINDPRDIWEIDPSGVEAPSSVTGGVGRTENIMFRIWPHPVGFGFDMVGLPESSEPLDATQPLLLAAYDVDTKATGFWRTWIGSGNAPQPLVMLDKHATLVSRTTSSEEEQYLLSLQRFDEFPDLWTGRRLDELVKISDANPQQREYRWGTAELVNWTSHYGVPLKGVLYKPERFSRSLKYPLIVSLSASSGTLHLYRPPMPPAASDVSSLRSSLAVYLSKDYLVFMPDTTYTVPFPGEGVLASVMPGVRSIIDRGFVDSTRIGLAGYSQAGFAVNYLVTRTQLFRCAITGGTISNALSGYSGIYLESGRASSFMFEAGVLMHGRSLWQDPLVYLSNSPLLFADRVQAPLLMLHNQDDEAAPFTQAIELYIALRRNRKEVYLFSYHEEKHGLYKYSNQLHWDHRMQEFFDYYLKGAPKPGWMVRGFPYENQDDGRLSEPHPTA